MKQWPRIKAAQMVSTQMVNFIRLYSLDSGSGTTACYSNVFSSIFSTWGENTTSIINFGRHECLSGELFSDFLRAKNKGCLQKLGRLSNLQNSTTWVTTMDSVTHVFTYVCKLMYMRKLMYMCKLMKTIIQFTMVAIFIGRGIDSCIENVKDLVSVNRKLQWHHI